MDHPWTGHLSLLQSAQTGYGVPPASNSIAARGSFHGSKAAGAVKLTTHAKLVPNLRKLDLQFHSPLAFMAGEGTALLFRYASLHTK